MIDIYIYIYIYMCTHPVDFPAATEWGQIPASIERPLSEPRSIWKQATQSVAAGVKG